MNQQEQMQRRYVVNTAIHGCVELLAQCEVAYDAELIKTIRNVIIQRLVERCITTENDAYPPEKAVFVVFAHHMGGSPIVIVEAQNSEDALEIAFMEYGVSLASCSHMGCDDTLWNVAGQTEDLSELLEHPYNLKFSLNSIQRKQVKDGDYIIWRQ